MASVSTHVLDAALGGSRPGVRVRIRDAEGKVVGDASSDAGGRIDLASSVPTGTYQVTWEIDGDFVASVTATVHLSEERHYHLPIVASGFAASIYLGG